MTTLKSDVAGYTIGSRISSNIEVTSIVENGTRKYAEVDNSGRVFMMGPVTSSLDVLHWGGHLIDKPARLDSSSNAEGSLYKIYNNIPDIINLSSFGQSSGSFSFGATSNNTWKSGSSLINFFTNVSGSAKAFDFNTASSTHSLFE